MFLKHRIKYAQITDNKAENYDVYLEIAESSNAVQKMLLFPLDRWLKNPKKMAQQLFSELKAHDQNQSDEHDKSIIGVSTGFLQILTR